MLFKKLVAYFNKGCVLNIKLKRFGLHLTCLGMNKLFIKIKIYITLFFKLFDKIDHLNH